MSIQFDLLYAEFIEVHIMKRFLAQASASWCGYVFSRDQKDFLLWTMKISSLNELSEGKLSS